MYRLHTVCRACGFGRRGPGGIKSGPVEQLVEVLDLGIQPLANDFKGEDEPRCGYAPLRVLVCPKCGLAQLSVTVDPSILYSKYSYVTSPGVTMHEHFEALARDIAEEVQPGGLVEIGSNDGLLLEFFRGKGWGNVCGIDPAENLTNVARSRGVPSITGFFNYETATDARSVVGRANAVIARHVFCHLDDWTDFLQGLAVLCSQETLICIEVPNVMDLLQNGEFDTIYHEHLSYLSLSALQTLLNGTPFQIHDVKQYPIHGGTMLVMLRMRNSTKPPNFLGAVNLRPMADVWQEFAVRTMSMIDSLELFVRQARQEGKRVAGLGASAKSTVWITVCGFTAGDICWIADNTPQKLYKFSPGANIPIVDEGAILRDLPEYVICFAWNFREEILAKNARARELGVKFVFPVPKLEVV